MYNDQSLDIESVQFRYLYLIYILLDNNETEPVNDDQNCNELQSVDVCCAVMAATRVNVSSYLTRVMRRKNSDRVMDLTTVTSSQASNSI